MDIQLKTVNSQRYDTYGDYFKKGDKDIITVIDSGIDIYNKLVAIHELIELVCTEYHGIKEEDITKFDIEHSDEEEPGEHPDSPYRKDHMLAELIERLICNHLDINFKEYNNYLYKVLEDAEQSRLK